MYGVAGGLRKGEFGQRSPVLDREVKLKAKLAELEQQTPFAGLRSRHKEILLNNAECGSESGGTPQAKELCQRKSLLCKRIPSTG